MDTQPIITAHVEFIATTPGTHILTTPVGFQDFIDNSKTGETIKPTVKFNASIQTQNKSIEYRVEFMSVGQERERERDRERQREREKERDKKGIHFKNKILKTSSK